MNVGEFLLCVKGIKKTNAGWQSCCPGHDDHEPSLCISEGTDGRILVKCQAGCSTETVVKAMSLKMSDLFAEKATAKTPPRIVATYDYQDEAGALLFQVVRYEPKMFRQRRPDATAPGGIVWNMEGVRRVLYRLPEIIAAVKNGELIVLVEGEKDVSALVHNGFAATCNPGGAGKWSDDYSAVLVGADVVIVADKDDTGRRHAQLVAGKLHGSAKSIRIAELPDINDVPVKDAYDYFAAGTSPNDFRKIIETAPIFTRPAGLYDSATVIVSGSAGLQFEEEDNTDTPAPFPLGALPTVMSDFIAGVSNAERVPLALPAICALGVVSAAVGAGLEVKSGPNRVTRANLYLLASAESGSGKSETFRIVAAPLLEHQARLHGTWSQKTSPHMKSDILVLEKEIMSLQRKAAKVPDAADREKLRAELEARLLRKDELERQAAMPTLIAQDVTTERLAGLLRDNREVLFSTTADARKVVQNLMGRYNPGNTTDESLYLSTYSGDYVRVDRQGRDPVVLVRPCLALCWFIQPDLLEIMLDEDTLSVSGFLPRLLTCHTNAAPRRIEGVQEILTESIKSDWNELISDLIATFHDAKKPFTIDATPEAMAILTTFHNSIVDRRAADLADVGPFAARYAENAWRLAAVLHAARWAGHAGKESMSDETATNAVRVIEWFIQAQLGILAKGRRAAATKMEEEVLALLKSHNERKGKDFMTARDVHRGRITLNAEAAKALLVRMEADGVLSGEDITPQHGGKTTRIYRAVNNPIAG